MKKSILLMGLLTIFAMATVSCGADPGATEQDQTVVHKAALSADRAVGETNRVVRLDCGEHYVEITKAEGFGERESEAEEDCEDRIVDERPSVRCDRCSIRGACRPETRRSDIITHCERDGDSWDCECAQRTVIGCWPCRDDDDADRASFDETLSRCAQKEPMSIE